MRIGRPQQVASLLEDIFQWRHPADQCVSYYFRQHRHLGGRDRAEIAQAVFDVLRHLRRYRRDAQSGPGPLNLCLAWRGLSATLPDASQTLGADAPMQEWVKRCEQIDEQSLPFEVRFSLPDWLAQRIQAMPEPDSLARSFLRSAAIDLRVNTVKADRDSALTQVREMLTQSSRHGFDAKATPYSDVGIRLKGHPPIQRWALFEQGVLEVQDEGSQLLAKLVDPKRQEMVIDFCAGAGGKTLALGAMMRSTGRLYAFDVSAPRLARAKPRFARSGLSNIHPVVIRPEGDDRVRRLAGKAHRVLIDAPCTGLGTLRRNPDLKWRQSADELDRLQIEQALILEQASICVRPGGRLVYATCSVLAEENEAQVVRFLESHPEFTLIDARALLAAELTEGGHSAVDDQGMVRFRPDWHGTDGFFAAVMQRQGSLA
ncbi:RsmB/NOP family class I SAM-dependent RNA methyltransferase [Orrella marina]|uniref:RsmB/NOP family class I SAM-dependent RNA methyltransferase n=1 Tax=Orrella marina TaxID=2163011 RepID=UPI001D130CFC|nr:RsmB/NOP family class I SAM-dependent RNA methyltransferase [Orrella marina]